MTASFMASLANLLGNAKAAKQVLTHQLPMCELTTTTPSPAVVELLLSQAPNQTALSNCVLLLDLIEDEQSQPGLLAIYERRLAEFQPAPSTTEPL